jgi:HEAT repeat protein/beta-lactamase regulating signal transducer with metallopeptidase domain
MTMAILEILQSSFNWLPVIDLVVKATLLLACAALLTTALRRSSAATRHLIWTAALMAALALPVLSLTLPRWNVPVLTVSAPDRFAATPAASMDVASSRMAATIQPRLGSSRPMAAPSSTPSTILSRFSLPQLSWPALIACIWAAGALMILARLAIGIGVVHWMSRRTEIVTDAPWLALAREIAAQLGLTRVTFRRSHQPAMPMAWGVFRPSVLMPADADAWPHERLRIVLLHELAHVRRADCLTHILAQTACALYWMNPLAWIAARRLRTERERACDDLVLACGTPGPDYADQLLEIARAMGSGRFSRTAAAASLAMAHRSQLEGRLMSILDPSIPRHSVNRVWAAAASTLALLTIVPLASLQPWVYAAPAMIPAETPQQTAVVQKAETKVSVQQKVNVENAVVNQEIVHGAVQGAMQGISQGAIQGIAQGAVQGITQGITQGVTQGITQGVSQGVLQGVAQRVIQSVPAALSGALDNALNVDQSSKADPKVVAALTEALKDSDKEVRESAMHALVQMRDPGIFDPLVLALKDVSPDVRESAAFGLGQLRDKRAVAPLTAALKDSAANVREQVVFALGQLRDPAAVDGLAAALKDENADVREQAAFALGQLRDERAIQPLISVIKDPSDSVREQAVFALGQLRARAAVDPLIIATKDANAEVRAQAVFALGQTRDPRAIDALTAALKDSSVEVRQQAAFALGQISR